MFGAARGVYLSRRGGGRGKLIASGGRNPAYNDIKRQVVTYETTLDGHSQIGYRDLGRAPRIISARGGSSGNRDSRAPVIGNSGYYVTFESDASNLGANALGREGTATARPTSTCSPTYATSRSCSRCRRRPCPCPAAGATRA